jgi:hypothetical protein
VKRPRRPAFPVRANDDFFRSQIIFDVVKRDFVVAKNAHFRAEFAKN